jgi:hypothetical protein
MKYEGLLQPLIILQWKWDDISVDFIMGLPLTARKFDSIWVIVLCLHRVLKTIISDQDS